MSRTHRRRPVAASRQRLHELTIRQLLIELARAEERLSPVTAHELDADAVRDITRRQHAIVAELRSRHRV
jgi:hypothetical protein